MDFKKAVDWDDSTPLAFHGLRPGNVKKTLVIGQKAARGLSQRTASDRGHFYAYADKRGTLRVHTNHYPWRDYMALGKTRVSGRRRTRFSCPPGARSPG